MKVSPGVLPEKARLLLQCGQHIGPNCLFQLRGRKLLIRTLVDPGLRRVSLPVLLELFEQLAQSSPKQASGSPAGQGST